MAGPTLDPRHRGAHLFVVHVARTVEVVGAMQVLTGARP